MPYKTTIKAILKKLSSYLKSFSLVFLAICIVSISFLNALTVNATEVTLGGVDLAAYCRKRFNNNGTARLNGSNVWSWSCGDLPIDTNKACQQQYGVYYANANYSNYNDSYSWYCEWGGSRRGGMDMQKYCRDNYAPESSTENGHPSNVYGWRCGNIAIDTNAACRNQYNSSSYSKFTNQNDPYSWKCYQDVAPSINFSLNDRVKYNSIQPPLYVWNSACGTTLKGKIWDSNTQGTITDAPNLKKYCYGGNFTWNRVRFDNGIEGYVASDFLIKTGTAVPRCGTPFNTFCVEYYNNRDASGLPVATWDDGGKPRWNWGAGSPPGVQADNFSGYWQGYWFFSEGNYNFNFDIDDGVRLWVDGELIADQWPVKTNAFTVSKYMTNGNHKIEMKYVEALGVAKAFLDWQRVNFDIDESFNVNADFYGDPNQNEYGKSPKVDLYNRSVKFNLFYAPAARKTALKSKWDGKSKVWIVIHGWYNDINDMPDKNNVMYLDSLASQLARARPNDVVLTLDWRSAAYNNGIADGGNFRAAQWIRPVAEQAQQRLTNWGLRSDQLSNVNFIGHSLGSFMSAEVAHNLDAETKGQSRVSTIIALDPASDINGGANFTASCAGWYDLDGKSSDCDRPREFSAEADFSRAFVGLNSFAGSYDRASSANEAYVLDYGDKFDLGKQHGYVYETFRQMLKNSSDVKNPLDYKLGIIEGDNNGSGDGIDKYFWKNYKYNSFSGLNYQFYFEGIVMITDISRKPDFLVYKNTNNQYCTLSALSINIPCISFLGAEMSKINTIDPSIISANLNCQTKAFVNEAIRCSASLPENTLKADDQIYLKLDGNLAQPEQICTISNQNLSCRIFLSSQVGLHNILIKIGSQGSFIPTGKTINLENQFTARPPILFPRPITLF